MNHPRAVLTRLRDGLTPISQVDKQQINTLLDALEAVEKETGPDSEEASFRRALLFAYAYELGERWLAWERKNGQPFMPERWSAIVDKIFTLADEVRENKQTPRTSHALSAVQEKLMTLYLADIARRAGCPEAEELLASGIGQVRTIVGFDTNKLRELAPYLFRLIDRIGREDNPNWISQLRGLLRDVQIQFAENRGNFVLHADYTREYREKAIPALNQVAEKGWRRIGYYGGGLHTARLFEWAQDGFIDMSGVEVVGIIDDNQQHWGQDFYNVPVMSMAEMIALRPDAVVLSSDTYEKQLAAKCDPLQQADIPIVRIYT